MIKNSTDFILLGLVYKVNQQLLREDYFIAHIIEHFHDNEVCLKSQGKLAVDHSGMKGQISLHHSTFCDLKTNKFPDF